MNRIIRFWAEVRDRRLFRILVSYLAGGWILLQAVDQLVGQALLPDLAYRLVLTWYVVGIPAAAIIGWFHGERGDQKAQPLEIFSLSVLGLVCLGLSSVAVSSHLKQGMAAEAAESGLNLNRIAVAYFQDLSADGEQQYLADGLTEDLIGQLSRVASLDIISQSGVAAFRGSGLPSDSIGRLVEAGTIVDGTVESVGDRLRINVRLLDASGAEFRRATFERPADDLAAIRTTVAEESSRMLREWLGESIRLRNRRAEAETPAAWALVQRAEKARKDGEALLHHDDLAGMNREFERADELLAQAEAVDPSWTTPTLVRGHIAHRRARLAHDPPDRLRWIDVGLGHAERLLARRPNDAHGLELRGLLRYWHYLQDNTPDPKERQRLLQGAREDLESAVRIEPSLASAHSALSHLYYRFDDIVGVVLAARRAYEEDAYLEAADAVLWRLVMGLYDLQQFTEARRWCSEGDRRFPEDHRFTECQLLLMTTREVTPDVERAWSLAERLKVVAPEPRRAHDAAKGELLAGGVIARAGLPDSARAVLDRARRRLNHQIDPSFELHLLHAYMRVLAGEDERAVAALREYAAVNPDYSFEHYWWWDELRANPDFQQLARSTPNHHDPADHGH